MPSTYSPDLRIELIGTGDQAGVWGATTNINLGTLLEAGIAGYTSVAVGSANQAFTANNGAADEARNAVIALTTSTSANFAVYAPPCSKLYVIYNASSYTATIYNSTVLGNTTAAGTGVAIPAGKTMTVWSDGTNMAQQNTHLISPSFTTPALGTPASGTMTNVTGLPIDGGTTGTLPVARGGTGVTTSTGTGSTVLSASPALTGTPTAPTAAYGTNTTQIATTAFVQAAGLVGEIKMWSTNTAPTGYLLCNGAAVSRSTYADLFAVVGTTWGSGDGSTTFNLPDFRNRMPIGAGTTYSANSQGGSADAIVVSHTHTATVTDSGHSHGFLFSANAPTGSGYVAAQGANSNANNNLSAPSSVQSNTTGISVSNSTTGSSGTNANLPPYLGVFFIIKT